MSASTAVILDACVLAPFSVCDLFLRLAEEPRLYMPRWSKEILGEVRRTQIEKLSWPESLADYWQHEVAASFPEALITAYQPLLERCTNDVKDRHVLAATLKAHISTIVTFNLKHFPVDSVEPHGVEVVRPDEFLITLYGEDSEAVYSRLRDIAESRGMEPVGVLRKLQSSLPAFARHVASVRGWTL